MLKKVKIKILTERTQAAVGLFENKVTPLDTTAAPSAAKGR